MAKAKALKAKRSLAEMPAEDYSPREAQERFERAVDVAVATKPLHKEASHRVRGKKRL